MINIELIIEQLKSWGRSYIPPSAQITMDDAARIIITQDEEIKELKEEIEKLKNFPPVEIKLTKPSTAKAAPRKRTKKVI
jgi:hypothetical protein